MKGADANHRLNLGGEMQDLIGHFLTFLVGLGAGIVIKIKYDSSRWKKTVITGDTVNQSRNKVGGNMSGRDMHVTKD